MLAVWQVLDAGCWDILPRRYRRGERVLPVEVPNVFAQPWKMSMLLYRRKERNSEILEYERVAYLEQESRARNWRRIQTRWPNEQ